MEDKREDQAEEFAYRFKQEYGLTFDPENLDTLVLRMKLIAEEANEAIDAGEDIKTAMLRGTRPSEETVAHFLKELADLQYVLSGCAVAFGLPLQEAVDEVHESNMTKIGDDGMAKFNDAGKVLKGPHYRPAEMQRVVRDYLLTEYPKENE